MMSATVCRLSPRHLLNSQSQDTEHSAMVPLRPQQASPWFRGPEASRTQWDWRYFLSCPEDVAGTGRPAGSREQRPGAPRDIRPQR